MKLVQVQIQNYKIIEDSTPFKTAEVTCLVGKNESGKSAILEALYKLKPVEEDQATFDDIDYPRRHVSDYRDRKDQTTHANVLTTKWKLDDDDVKAATEVLGFDPFTSRDVELKKGYANRLEWSASLDQATAINMFVSKANLSEADKAHLAEAKTTSDLFTKLRGMTEKSDALIGLLASLETAFPQGSLTATTNAFLTERLPTFLYFSDYFRLPGRAALDPIISRKSAGTLTREDKVFNSLLDLARSSVEEIQQTGTIEALNMELEAIQNRITREVFEFWTQNQHLKVLFKFDQARSNDVPPFNTGFIFSTRIYNTRHDVSVLFDQRSTGFIWFVSFLVWFSQVRKHYGENLLILLDEPGLNLHGTAQGDLLRYIQEKLKPHFQVLYTTHSPFMIDPESILDVRTVEDKVSRDANGRDVIEGTKVGGEVLSTDADTLLPLQGALGYEITQTLWVGPYTLLVEGPSDILYVKVMSSELRRLKRVALDPRWTISPAGGIDKVQSFVSLFSGKVKGIAVLADMGTGDKGKVDRLRKGELMKAGHVLSADQYANQNEADIEDIIGRANYTEIIKQCYDLKKSEQLPVKPAPGAPIRCVKEVEAHMMLQASKPEFDHFEPSRYFLENFAALKATLPELGDALDRFEKLFTDLNGLLPPK